MPPEITAGLMALAEPPGAGAGLRPAKPPADGPLNAVLFASLLAQSSLPTPTTTPKQAAAPKQAPAEQNTGAVPSSQPPAKGAVRQAAITASFLAADRRIAPKTGKTMDTLPKRSVPVKEKPKATASELPLQSQQVQVPNEPVHKAPADAIVPNTPVCTANLTGAALVSAVSCLVQASSVQSALPPTPLSASLAGAVAPPATTASLLYAPFAMPLAKPADPAPVSLPATLQSGPEPGPAPQPPLQVSPSTQASQTAVTAGVAAAPGAATPDAQPLAKFSAKFSAAASAAVGLQAARLFLPNIFQPNIFQSKEAAAPQALGRQQAASGQRLPFVPAPAFAVSIAAPAVAASVFPQPAVAVPALSVPAKSAGKAVPAALKPAGGNADTYTRTLPGEAAVAARTPAASAKPLPSFGKQHATPETLEPAKMEPAKSLDTKKTAEWAAPPELIGSVPETQVAVVKPLSAADHAAMVRQVAEGVGAMPLPMRPGAAQQMSLQLHPKDWGSLQVSVSVAPGPDAAAKTVTAHIVAETLQVKAALQSQSGALHQALRASGLNLEHLTVSVKPPAETVKAASASASAGFSSGQESGQGQASTGSQPQSNPQAGPPSGAASFGSTAFGSGSQDPRQGQFAPAFASPAASAEPDTEDITIERLPMRPASGRIDTLA